MKTTTIILMAIGFISLTNCEPKTATNTMLENTETRTELLIRLLVITIIW
jgi:hypothetical protein